jgi:hypothetical protein
MDASFRICQERGIRLTEQAKLFLRLAAEALIKDPSRSPNSSFRKDEFGPGGIFWLETGTAILSEALEDERVSKEMSARKRVSFPTLIRVLADAGHKQFRSYTVGMSE